MIAKMRDVLPRAEFGPLARGVLAVLLVSVAAGCGGSDGTPGTMTTSSTTISSTPVAVWTLPAIRHVFTIILENENYNQTFGANSPATYLSQQLTPQGTLLQNYYAIGHESLGNYVALVSGQAPNLATQSDCAVFLDFSPAMPQIDSNGQAIGQGCVYPAEIQTIAGQLAAANFAWRGYMEDMPAACTHPALNTADTTQTASAKSQYANHHNPFIYFHAILDSPVCAQNVVPLQRLTTDLEQVSSTPNFVFITPNLCHDGHDTPCADGEPGGLVSADSFLRLWVPQILASSAYQQDGMLVVLVDEAASDSSACCNEQSGPNVSQPGGNGPGGGRIGALVLSKFAVAGAVVSTAYNHYSFLRTVEDLFGLGYLGFAGQSGLASFGADVFPAGMN